MNLSDRECARLARQLITECGGLDEAARNCRVSKSVLSGYQNPHDRSTMPMAVISELEAYCGRPVVSEAMFDSVKAAQTAGHLGALACELSENTLELQHVVRAAISDDQLTPRELDAIAAAERSAEQALERLKGARRAAETQRPELKAV
jgi:hypothetical protein